MAHSHDGAPLAGPSTQSVHAGMRPEPITGAIMTPVFFTSTYVQESPAKHKGYEYSRTHNPTRTALQEALASLESPGAAAHGVCFSSGMGATDTILKLLSSGDRVVAGNDLYGGTYRIFTKVFERFGLRFTFVDTTDTAATERAVAAEKTAMVWLESPSNPLLRVSDIAAISRAAKAAGALTVVDNTFATPILQRPLELGADLVCHSTTKYLGGHSDVVGGAVVVRDAGLHDRLRFLQNACGATPGPMDCFLTHRGIKTLALRMDRHCRNAAAIANFLSRHPRVARVHYPGLEKHPGHETAKRQMSDFGGMVSFELTGTVEEGMAFCARTKLFSCAESLGGVESLIEHPPSMTHASIPPEVRRAAGLADGLIRLSVGVEDAADLIMDLERAF